MSRWAIFFGGILTGLGMYYFVLNTKLEDNWGAFWAVIGALGIYTSISMIDECVYEIKKIGERNERR